MQVGSSERVRRVRLRALRQRLASGFTQIQKGMIMSTQVTEALGKDDIPQGMEEITVEVGPEERRIPVAFTGRWLVHPDEKETRTTEDGRDAGAFYGVAQTAKGRIAVYVAHCNDRWEPVLLDYVDLDAAAASGDVPADIIAMAARELGESRPVRLDI